MTKQEFDELYVGEYKAVHCDTEEKAKQFLELAHSFGYQWCTKDSFLNDTLWRYHKDETCYAVRYGTYDNIFGYESCGYKIVEYILNIPTKPMPLKHRMRRQLKALYGMGRG